MRNYAFVTVDVFTDRRFGGNPLAVFPDARGLSEADMQALAGEFNLSETAFVLPPGDPSNAARVRIFSRSSEMTFAGHPNVGTAYVLAHAGVGGDDGKLRFEQLAGIVEVQLERDVDGQAVGAEITAPEPLRLGRRFDPADVAACTGLDLADVVTSAHPPQEASMGNPFVIAEVTPESLCRAAPDSQVFRRIRESWAGPSGRLAMHLYARDGGSLRARMFSPLSGTVEDPATGSANAALAGMLLSQGGESSLLAEVVQGVEMGRPSLLRVTAFRNAQGIAGRVAGTCVPVLRGEATV